ncbi:hypothetical protein [Pseudodesulfovibrio sp.]|uniref:hypothetical protein n=1 Tax=unclassified Pseudodesulfovibrio TaxID=2661612 RepID=UPI003B004202
MPSLKAPLRIPATKGIKAWPLLCVFPGDHRETWRNYGGSKNNFRLQIGNSFYSRPNERRSFLSASELGRILAEMIAKACGVPLGDTPNGTVTLNLYMPQGAKVWVFERGNLPKAEIVSTTPFQRDGEWLVGLGYSRRTVPLKMVKPRTESLAECTIDQEDMEEN